MRHACVVRVQAGDGHFDIQPIRIMLVYSVNEKTGGNRIIGLFIFEAVCSTHNEHLARRAHVASRATARNTKGSLGEIESGTAG